MQSSTCSKNTFYKKVGSESAFFFDNSHEFGTSYGMFDTYPNAGNFPVELFFFSRKHLSFLDRLYDYHLIGGISLISGVLIQGARYGKRIHRVSHLFIMCFPTNGLADKENQTGNGNNNGILDRMTFLFSAVLLFLFISITRTGNLSFGAVMKQYRLTVPSLESSDKCA